MLLALKGPRTVERGEGDEKRGLSLRVGVRVGVEDEGVVGREGAGEGDGDGDLGGPGSESLSQLSWNTWYSCTVLRRSACSVPSPLSSSSSSASSSSESSLAESSVKGCSSLG